jgi:hypothetical protein
MHLTCILDHNKTALTTSAVTVTVTETDCLHREEGECWECEQTTGKKLCYGCGTHATHPLGTQHKKQVRLRSVVFEREPGGEWHLSGKPSTAEDIPGTWIGRLLPLKDTQHIRARFDVCTAAFRVLNCIVPEDAGELGYSWGSCMSLCCSLLM